MGVGLLGLRLPPALLMLMLPLLPRNCHRFEARQLPEVVSRGPPEQQQRQQHAADAPHTQRQREQGEREHYTSRYLAADPGVPACDPRLQPSATWTRDFLQQFSQLRRRLHRCGHMPAPPTPPAHAWVGGRAAHACVWLLCGSTGG